MPVVGAAAVTAAATVGGTAIQARGVSRASAAQERAAREAIQYQREQEWRGRMDARSQYDEYMRSAYGDRYQPAGRTAAAPSASPVVSGVTPAADQAIVAPLPTARPEVETPPLVGTPAAPMRTMADLGGWSASNYSRYLGGRR